MIFSTVIASALLTALQTEPPQFNFVLCRTTEKHIAVQPQTDYHRVHFHTRVENMRGKIAFARVRYQADGGDEAMIIRKFRPSTNNEIWQMYFRVPRFGSTTAKYQIELGEFDLQKLNEFDVLQTFGWEIPRNNNQDSPPFVHVRNGEAITMPILMRVAEFRGGTIHISTAYPKPKTAVYRAKIVYGWSYEGAESEIDGDSMVKRQN